MPVPPSASGVTPRPVGVRQGQDRCPGTLRLHEAADGFLARVRVPGGRLQSTQVQAVGSAAADLGDGAVHVTSRGNLQLRGLAPDAGQPLADRLHAAGLLPSPEHDRIRNVLASPLSGLDGRGLLDVGPLVDELDALMCAADALTALSGRFLLGLDDGRGDVLGRGPDLTAVAEQHAVRLWVGARPTTRTCFPHEAARLLVEAAHDFLRVRSACAPDVWRVADLGADAERIAPWATGVRTPVATPLAAGPVRGPSGVTAVSVLFPLGQASPQAWAALRDASSRTPSTAVRITPWRGAVIAGAGEQALSDLEVAGLITGADAPLVDVTACTGRPGCASARSDVRREAAGLRLRARAGYPLHVSGCERRCGHGTGPRVEAIATAEGRYTLHEHDLDSKRGPGAR